MTDSPRYPPAPAGPPWSVDTLAELHAGALDETTAGRLRSGLADDTEARAVLTALDATRADLGVLRDVPPVPVPAAVAARIDALLATEARTRVATAPDGHGGLHGPPAPATSTGTVVDLTAARRRRNRVLGWGSGAVAVAAAVIAVVFAITPGLRSTPGHGVAAPAPGDAGTAPPALALTSGDLGRDVLGKAMSMHDAGPFADRHKLAGCLAANHIDAARQVVSIGQVTMDGRPATLMVLTTGQRARFRLLAVQPSCQAGNPATLANTVVGPH